MLYFYYKTKRNKKTGRGDIMDTKLIFRTLCSGTIMFAACSNIADPDETAVSEKNITEEIHETYSLDSGKMFYTQDSAAYYYRNIGKRQSLKSEHLYQENDSNSTVLSDTIIITQIDTLRTKETDTLIVPDTLVISIKDTLVIKQIDTVVISKQDTLHVSQIDTLFIETSKESGTGILDFNPESVIIPKLENLIHQKRTTGYKLQQQQIVLLHFTDIHGDLENLKRIKEFKDKYSKYFDAAIHTGDAVYYRWSDPFDFWNEAKAGEFMNTLGNHDINFSTESGKTLKVSNTEVYNRYFAPYISSWDVVQPDNAEKTGLMYYYKDIDKGTGLERAKLRIIVLDEYHWNNAQTEWLTNVLEDARINDFAVIICRHDGFDAIPLKNNPFSSLEHIGSSTSLKEAQVAVDEFMQKGGEFVVWLGGHSHQDAVGRLPDYPKQIIFLSDMASMNWTGWNDSWRQSGTKTQDCFTIIGIDRFEKVVRFLRIGADRDRYERVKDAMSINYGTSEALYPAE